MPKGSALKHLESYHITGDKLRLYYKKKNVGRFYDIAELLKQPRATENAHPRDAQVAGAKAGEAPRAREATEGIQVSSQEDGGPVVTASASVRVTGRNRKGAI